jgi:hypothetical protein
LKLGLFRLKLLARLLFTLCGFPERRIVGWNRAVRTRPLGSLPRLALTHCNGKDAATEHLEGEFCARLCY